MAMNAAILGSLLVPHVILWRDERRIPELHRRAHFATTNVTLALIILATSELWFVTESVELMLILFILPLFPLLAALFVSGIIIGLTNRPGTAIPPQPPLLSGAVQSAVNSLKIQINTFKDAVAPEYEQLTSAISRMQEVCDSILTESKMLERRAEQMRKKAMAANKTTRDVIVTVSTAAIFTAIGGVFAEPLRDLGKMIMNNIF